MKQVPPPKGSREVVRALTLDKQPRRSDELQGHADDALDVEGIKPHRELDTEEFARMPQAFPADGEYAQPDSASKVIPEREAAGQVDSVKDERHDPCDENRDQQVIPQIRDGKDCEARHKFSLPPTAVSPPTVSPVKPSAFSLDDIKVPPREAVEEAALAKAGCDKPDGQMYFRIRPGGEHTCTAYVLKFGENPMDKKYHLVFPQVADEVDELKQEVLLADLCWWIDRTGMCGIFIVPRPDAEGGLHPAYAARREAVERAATEWIRLAWNRRGKAYVIIPAKNQDELGEPTYPEITFEKLVRNAFKGRIIGSVDHEVVQRLLGLK